MRATARYADRALGSEITLPMRWPRRGREPRVNKIMKLKHAINITLLLPSSVDVKAVSDGCRMIATHSALDLFHARAARRAAQRAAAPRSAAATPGLPSWAHFRWRYRDAQRQRHDSDRAPEVDTAARTQCLGL